MGLGCKCFSASDTGGYHTQRSFPEPPEIVTPGGDNARDIFSRISDAISPIEVARDRATVNYAGSRSTDLDQDGLSHHVLLTRPSGGFRRMDSMQTVASWQGTGDVASTAESPHSGGLQRSQSERGYQPKAKGTVPLPNNIWTESRKDLELVIQAEKAKDHADWNPDLNSQEERLRKRLAKLKLEMKVMVGDGNCLFRAVSYGLYGSQDYHRSVRQKAVDYMKAHKEDFDAFLGENVDSYLEGMACTGTWGDELTLRAISDLYGVTVSVVSSDQHNWFMRYKPPKINYLVEIFLTYIAPVHYNAIRRQTVAGTLRRTMSRQSSSIETAIKRAVSAERDLAATSLSPEVARALANGYKMGSPGEPVAPSATVPHQRRKTQDMGQMEPVVEGVEGRVSVTSEASKDATNTGTRQTLDTPNSPVRSAFQDASQQAPQSLIDHPMSVPATTGGFAEDTPAIQAGAGDMPVPQSAFIPVSS